MCNMLRMSTQPTPDGRLQPMPAETWGWRFKRARMQVAGLNLKEAVQAVSYFTRTSESTILRLEKRGAAPRNWGKDADTRELATLLCLVYCVDPIEFDLSPDDLPPGIRAAVEANAQGGSTPPTAVTIRYSQAA